MNRILKNFRYAISFVPQDIKAVLIFLSMSAALMSIMLFSLFKILPQDNVSEGENVKFALCGREPYIVAKEAPLPTYIEAVKTEISAEGKAELLARAIERALPGESYVLRVAFGAVLLNRTESGAFPSSLSAVIKAAGLYPESFDSPLSERSLHAAKAAMQGVDPTLGALYIMNLSDPNYPEFEERITAIYGNFAFIE